LRAGSVMLAEARKTESLVRRLGPFVYRSAISVLLIGGSLAILGGL
jgi:hypothetical protein